MCGYADMSKVLPATPVDTLMQQPREREREREREIG